MKKDKITILFITILFQVNLLYSLNYITTAESIAWSGAYTSVATGFESMLYNPAGLYRTNKSYGIIPFFGTLGLRVYSSSLSSSEIVNLFYQPDRDIKKFAIGKIDQLYDFNINPEIGVNVSTLNFLVYRNMGEYSIGISILPKTYSRVQFEKSAFKFIFESFDLSTPFYFFVKGRLFQYYDLNYMMSTRVKFLEKRIPVFKEIYAGFSGHFYIAGFYADFDGYGEVSAGEPSNTFGIIPYNVKVKGRLTTGGITQIKVNDLLFGVIDYDFVSGTDIDNSIVDAIVGNKNAFGFGLGVDFGTLVVVNKMVSFGFSVTDLGFFTFPEASESSVEYNLSIDSYALAKGESTIDKSMSFKVESSQTKSVFMMTETAIRSGILFTPPIKNKFIDLKIASDISLADFNKIADSGYPTFNFALGVEFTPKTKRNIRFPLRASFSFNTEALNPSFSFGLGLYAGPVEFDFGIKGLEFLIDGWGAKEVQIGFDMKYEFD